MKNPWHPLFLDALAEVYPDTWRVMRHRDPVGVVASACSLINVSRAMFCEELDKEAMGKMMVETFDLMIERSLAYREKHGWDSIYDLLRILRGDVFLFNSTYPGFPLYHSQKV